MKKESSLTPKQRRFVEEYLVDVNGTQAAIRAGYSKKTAEVIAHELLKKTSVASAVDRAVKERSARIQIDADWVLRQAVELHKRCMQEVTPLTDRSGEPIVERGRAVFTFNAAGAAKSLEIVGKHVDVRAFLDRHSMSVSGGLGPTLAEILAVSFEFEDAERKEGKER